MISFTSINVNNGKVGSVDDDSGELESLNTDVFRFLSIITLILAILFSLVQSMPQSPSSEAPQLANVELLQQNIEQLQQQVGQLKQQLHQQALSSAQSASSTQSQIDVLHQHYQQQLTQAHNKLAELKQQSKQKTIKLTELQNQVALQQAKLQHIAKKIPLKTPIKQQAKPKLKPEPKTKTIAKPKPAPAKVGFSLGFSSEQAFFNLFNQQVAMLYLVKGKQVWRIQPNMQLQAHKGAIELYYLASNTLPSSLIHKLKRSTSITNQDQFALALPASIVGQIRQIMQQHKGGEITINAQGVVTVQN